MRLQRELVAGCARDFTGPSELQPLEGPIPGTPSAIRNILGPTRVTGHWRRPSGRLLAVSPGLADKPADFRAGVTSIYIKNVGFDVLPGPAPQKR